MRILTITHYAELLGANRSLLHLVEGLRERGVEVQVWCPKEGAFTEKLSELGISYRCFPFANGAYSVRSVGFFSFFYKWRKTTCALAKFAALAHDFRPDIIHSNSSVVALGALVAEKLDIPHVWHIREYGWLDYQLHFLVGQPFMRKYMQKAAAIIAISSSIRKHIQREYEFENLKNGKAICEIYNGIGKQQAIEKLGESLNSGSNKAGILTFLIIGLLHPSKNQLQALRAFHLFYQKYTANTAHLHPPKLQIIGGGRRDYEAQLRRYIQKNNLQNCVEMIGFVDEPAPYYQAASAVLMCSPNEAMGRVTAEAMAYRKPVIGYRGGATPELITPNENGFLYDGSDADLAEKMAVLASSETAFLERIAENAQKTVLARFTDEVYTEQVWQVFN
ncbi:MAG: hypothetical protein RI894_1590, partial [Bacteroidota bacterium]